MARKDLALTLARGSGLVQALLLGLLLLFVFSLSQGIGERMSATVETCPLEGLEPSRLGKLRVVCRMESAPCAGVSPAPKQGPQKAVFITAPASMKFPYLNRCRCRLLPPLPAGERVRV